MTRSIQNKGLYLALVSQLNKLARHNRQGSFRTKDRYYEACTEQHQWQAPCWLCAVFAGAWEVGFHHKNRFGSHSILP